MRSAENSSFRLIGEKEVYPVHMQTRVAGATLARLAPRLEPIVGYSLWPSRLVGMCWPRDRRSGQKTPQIHLRSRIRRHSRGYYGRSLYLIQRVTNQLL